MLRRLGNAILYVMGLSKVFEGVKRRESRIRFSSSCHPCFVPIFLPRMTAHNDRIVILGAGGMFLPLSIPPLISPPTD